MSTFPTPLQIVNPALGTDLSGTTDLTPQMAEVSGRRALAELLLRRIITPRGGNIDALGDGVDLTGFLNDDTTESDVAQLARAIETEWQKDERVISSQVSVQFVGVSQIQAARAGIVANPQPAPSGALVVVATVADAQGPFRLVIAATQVTVSLLEVGA